MKMLLPLLLLPAACAPGQAPYSPARNVHYSALGHDPFWMVTVGESKIVLTFGPPGDGSSKLDGHSYRGVSARMDDGLKRWDAGDGTAVISIEARREACTGARGALFEDRVRVRLSGRELHGCGGRLIRTGGAQ
jgi:uncharacterized membrane protein